MKEKHSDPWFTAMLLLPLGLFVPVAAEFVSSAPFGAAWLLAGIALVALTLALVSGPKE